ncbi:Kinesin-like protein FLA10 [Diplonema papillatum]|nr:Kinesin-like protein FLA10 [Diplonema papillatum]
MRKKDASSENVQVVVRVRPISHRELELKTKEVVTTDVSNNTVSVQADDSSFKSFTFDQIYNKQFDQKSIYLQTIHPLVQSVLAGYNATVFAYGQSGSGKTHTMTGQLNTPDQGIIPNALQHIFEAVRQEEAATKKQFTILVTYLELYNGKCRDLLTDTKKNLELKENEQKLFYVKDLEKMRVSSVGQCMQLMLDGHKRREVGSTLLNQDSSRSHSVFTVEVTCLNQEEEPPTAVVSKLNLVDLAGSERQTKTAAEGDRLKEGSNINLSLSALGTVIDVLVKGKGHIPFRSSPLTMLLKDSLGGNSRTVMFATVSPSDLNTPETVSTLRFADRAKKIKNKPRVQMDPKDALIAELREELASLKRQLGFPVGGTAGSVQEAAETQLDALQVQHAALQEEAAALAAEASRLAKKVAPLKAELKQERALHASAAEDLQIAKDTHLDTAAHLQQLSAVVGQYIDTNLSWASSVQPGSPGKPSSHEAWAAQLSGLSPTVDVLPVPSVAAGLEALALVFKGLAAPGSPAVPQPCDAAALPNGQPPPPICAGDTGAHGPSRSPKIGTDRQKRESRSLEEHLKSFWPVWLDRQLEATPPATGAFPISFCISTCFVGNA